ncbi:hypothetical protein HAX54_012840, partial [Datura stramonium]|nr:hypothetical protein [Datura stramonium]
GIPIPLIPKAMSNRDDGMYYKFGFSRQWWDLVETKRGCATGVASPEKMTGEERDRDGYGGAREIGEVFSGRWFLVGRGRGRWCWFGERGRSRGEWSGWSFAGWLSAKRGRRGLLFRGGATLDAGGSEGEGGRS